MVYQNHFLSVFESSKISRNVWIPVNNCKMHDKIDLIIRFEKYVLVLQEGFINQFAEIVNQCIFMNE